MSRWRPVPVIDSFMSKVEIVTESGCWFWMACLMNKGYGQFWNGEKVVLAHRASYSMMVGEIGGMDVLHKCDTPCCVNPDHLFLGTHRQNMEDMARKGRSDKNWKVRGSDSCHSRLSAGQVLEIRRLYATGAHSQRDLARQFDVSQPAIKCITKRQVWRHI